jgi:hypothetical protein
MKSKILTNYLTIGNTNNIFSNTLKWGFLDVGNRIDFGKEK